MQKQTTEQEQEKIISFLWELIIRGNQSILDKFFEKVKMDMKTPLTPLGMTSLHLATTCQHSHLVQYFIQAKGASVNYPDKNGRTALHYAAANGSFEIAEFLLNNGADINALTKGLETPIMKAAQFKQQNIIELFLNYGNLDLFIKNFSGYTFFDIIKAYHNEELYQNIYEKYFINKMCFDENTTTTNNNTNNNNSNMEVEEEKNS